MPDSEVETPVLATSFLRVQLDRKLPVLRSVTLSIMSYCGCETRAEAEKKKADEMSSQHRCSTHGQASKNGPGGLSGQPTRSGGICPVRSPARI